MADRNVAFSGDCFRAAHEWLRGVVVSAVTCDWRFWRSPIQLQPYSKPILIPAAAPSGETLDKLFRSNASVTKQYNI